MHRTYLNPNRLRAMQGQMVDIPRAQERAKQSRVADISAERAKRMEREIELFSRGEK